MDNEKTQLILQSYRPGGEDRSDGFFSEALDRVSQDSALAAWFAEQVNFDDAMRQALQNQMPPPGLRDAIRRIAPAEAKLIRPVWRSPVLLGMAALLAVLLAIGMLWLPRSDGGGLTSSGLARHALDLTVVDRVELGKLTDDPAKIHAWLAERGAPSGFDIPPALRDFPRLGCQTYTFDGVKVSLVCFALGKDQIAHLFVVEEGALRDAPLGNQPTLLSENGLSWAAWTVGGKTYVLTGTNVSREMLRRLI